MLFALCRTRIPSSSTSGELRRLREAAEGGREGGRDDGREGGRSVTGSSPVFVGLIYDIIVFDDPNGGGELPLSLLAEPEGRLLPFGAD